MPPSIRARVLALAAAAAAATTSVVAQAVPPEPASANAPVAPTVYKSLLAGYRPLRDDRPTPWRPANDKVASIGGWRAYAREAQAADDSASAAGGAVPAAERRAP